MNDRGKGKTVHQMYPPQTLQVRRLASWRSPMAAAVAVTKVSPALASRARQQPRPQASAFSDVSMASGSCTRSWSGSDGVGVVVGQPASSSASIRTRLRGRLAASNDDARSDADDCTFVSHVSVFREDMSQVRGSTVRVHWSWRPPPTVSAMPAMMLPRDADVGRQLPQVMARQPLA